VDEHIDVERPRGACAHRRDHRARPGNVGRAHRDRAERARVRDGGGHFGRAGARHRRLHQRHIEAQPGDQTHTPLYFIEAISAATSTLAKPTVLSEMP
jgi:hypothetical protein